MPRGKNWCFTLNNPTDDDKPLEWSNVVFIKYQLEKGDRTGTPHFQGVVQFEKRLRLAGVKCVSARAHWEICFSVPAMAVYCGKEAGRLEGPWEKGDMVVSGQRSDLMQAKSIIDDGGTTHDLEEAVFPTFIRNERGLSNYKRRRTKARQDMTQCIVYWGKTKIGKTTTVKQKYPDAYWHNGTKWFDDYEGEETVVFDDFVGQLNFHHFLQLVNHCPYRPEVKRGSVQFVAKQIVITTNIHPQDWYKGAPDDIVDAIMGRITTMYTRVCFENDWVKVYP